MSKQEIPVTPAVRFLRDNKIEFTPCFYDYVEKGGTAVSSQALGVDEHSVIKTLVMEDDAKKPMLVLMHGDLQVSTKQLARELGVKSVKPCDPETAQRHTGYMVGGTSPFGTRKPLPVILQKTIADLPEIHINGGKRGFLVRLSTASLLKLLSPQIFEISTQ